MAEISLESADNQGRHLFVDLNESIAVYDRRSGRTHVVDFLAAEVLRCAAALPGLDMATGQDLQALQRAVAGGLQVSVEDISSGVLEAAIERLGSAGLR